MTSSVNKFRFHNVTLFWRSHIVYTLIIYCQNKRQPEILSIDCARQQKTEQFIRRTEKYKIIEIIFRYCVTVYQQLEILTWRQTG